MENKSKKLAFFVFLVFIASVFAGTYNVIDSYLTLQASPGQEIPQGNAEEVTEEPQVIEETTIAPVEEQEELPVVEKRYGKPNPGPEPVEEEQEEKQKQEEQEPEIEETEGEIPI